MEWQCDGFDIRVSIVSGEIYLGTSKVFRLRHFSSTLKVDLNRPRSLLIDEKEFMSIERI